MSTKEFLQKLTAKSKLADSYNEEIIEFSKIILENFIVNCTKYAAEGAEKAPLYAFTMDYRFRGVRVAYMIKKGLLDVLRKETELEISFSEYIIDNEGKIIKEMKTETDSLEFGEFVQEKKKLARFGVISAHWN